MPDLIVDISAPIDIAVNTSQADLAVSPTDHVLDVIGALHALPVPEGSVSKNASYGFSGSSIVNSTWLANAGASGAYGFMGVGVTVPVFSAQAGAGGNYSLPTITATGPVITGEVIAYDTDTAAFITASGVSGNSITDPLDVLVRAFKTAGIWTKLHAIYPFVGGSASTHKWNLKDPRDLDAAFRLTFSGSWAHGANGLTSDGSTAYADTKFSPLANFASASSASLGVYSRTDISTAGGATPYDMGASDSSDTQATIVISKYSSGSSYYTVGSSTYAPNVVNSDGRGMYLTVRRDGTNTYGYKNGSQVVGVADSVTLGSQTLYIGASHRGAVATYFCGREFAFAVIGGALTGQEALDMYTAIQAFQTSLGRQV